MPSIAPVSIADGQATPVVRTFNPVNVIGGVATYEERTAGVPIGYLRTTLSFKRASKAAKNDRVYLRGDFPVTAVVNGETVKVRGGMFEMTILLPVSATQAERNDLAAYLKNWASTSIVQNMITNSAVIYG